MTTTREFTDDERPMVLACGYRSIASARTNNTFPAWLVKVPCRYKRRRGETPLSSDADGSIGSTRSSTSCCVWWRSKRDFLLLGRAKRRKSVTALLPKAAMAKLSHTVPWRRPDDTRFQSGTVLENHYNVSMTKSLWQMDQFLWAIDRHCLEQEESQIDKDDDDDSLAVAWRIFCRASHTSGLVKNDDDDGNAETHLADSVLTSGLHTSYLKESSRLGQYFCTPDNACQLVNRLMDWIRQQSLKRNGNMLFLEPSCGHGDIVWELLQQWDKSNIEVCSTTVIGYDVDPIAIEHCRQRPCDCASDRSSNSGRLPGVQWRHGDFLTSTPPELSSADTIVVALGGPPYTSGAGSGAAIKRDLPQSFLSHCINVWHADAVAFFLPERYDGEHPLHIPSDWSCETLPLASSQFRLQGKIEVTQPSVLQFFCRSTPLQGREMVGVSHV